MISWSKIPGLQNIIVNDQDMEFFLFSISGKKRRNRHRRIYNPRYSAGWLALAWYVVSFCCSKLRSISSFVYLDLS